MYINIDNRHPDHTASRTNHPFAEHRSYDFIATDKTCAYFIPRRLISKRILPVETTSAKATLRLGALHCLLAAAEEFSVRAKLYDLTKALYRVAMRLTTL